MKYKALYGDGTKRLRPEGCWSFCGKPGECASENAGCCRTFIPRIECPPPNQGETDIHGLKFGKRDYDDETVAWEKKRNILKAKGESVEDMPSWRPANDPFALVPIFMDPRKYVKGEREELWNPDRFQEAIMSSGEVIVAINEAGKYEEDPFTTDEYYNLRGKLISTFGRLFNSPLSTGNQKKKNRAVDVFVSAVDIIAVWCIEQYCQDEDDWMKLLLKYGNVKTEDEIREELKIGESSLEFFSGTDEEFEKLKTEAAERKLNAERKRQERKRRERGGYDFEF